MTTSVLLAEASLAPSRVGRLQRALSRDLASRALLLAWAVCCSGGPWMHGGS